MSHRPPTPCSLRPALLVPSYLGREKPQYLIRPPPPCSSLHSLRCFQPLVPSCLGREKPQYLVVAGLVFAPFVEPFIFDFEPPQPGRRRYEGGPRRVRRVRGEVAGPRWKGGTRGVEERVMLFFASVDPHLHPPPPCRILPQWNSSHLHLQMAFEWGLGGLPGEQVVTLVGLLPGSPAATGYAELARSPRRLTR